MSVPLFLLYMFSIGLAWVFGKKRKAEDSDLADA